MAEEITQQSSLRLVKGGFDLSRPQKLNKLDQAGTGHQFSEQTVTSVKAPLALGNVVNCGFYQMRNLSATGVVQIGKEVAGVFEPFDELGPGAVSTGRLATNNPFALALTTDVQLEYWILEA